MIHFVKFLSFLATVFNLTFLVYSAQFNTTDHNVKLYMPGVQPAEEEQYTCFAFEASQSGYVVEFKPTASSVRVHHMLLYGCKVPGKATGKIWNCLHHDVCAEGSRILYAWARNAPSLKLPEKVGVPVGRAAGVPYYVLQVHYGSKFIGNVFDYSGVTLHIVEQKPPNVAGIYLLVSGGMIPAQKSSHPLNMSCSYDNEAVVHPFAYRTHAHSLGRIITAYKTRDNKWTQIGKGNPQWPQRFYDVDHPINITKGDVILAQCIYDSTSRQTDTYIGAHGDNEMCNFYMYYYVDAKHENPFGTDDAACAMNFLPNLFDQYPKEASDPFPPKPELEHSGHQYVHKFAVTETKNWPASDIVFGQISGLSLDTEGNLVVFHRADRKWTDQSFNLTNHYMLRTNGPIMDDPIVTLNKDGAVIKRWGRGFFYMPHNLFIDSHDFIWATDVAMHQVFKFDPKQPASTPLLALGQEFKPGSDERHFCKPTAVVVSKKDGLIFVADGYCNDRIVKFDSSGKFLAQFGEKSMEVLPSGYPKLGTLTLPHDISIDESNRLLYVADRENYRVQIFDFNGYPTDQLIDPGFGSSVYSVDYCDNADIIYVINGVSTMPRPIDFQVFAFDAKTRQLLFSFKPQSGIFQQPHKVLSSRDCQRVFVGEAGPNKLWNFELSSLGVKKSNTAELTTKESMVSAASSAPTQIVIDQEAWWQLIVLLVLAIAVPILCVTSVCCCFRMRSRGGLKGLNLSLQHHYKQTNKKGGLPLLTDAFYGRSHKGFQPLRTEDIDALDDLTDDSESEDTVYNKRAENNFTTTGQTNGTNKSQYPLRMIKTQTSSSSSNAIPIKT